MSALSEIIRRIDDIEAWREFEKTPDDRIYPSVRVYNKSDVTIAHDTLTAVTFDTENWDTIDNNWVIGSPTRLTVHRPGVYAIFGNVVYTANANGVRGLTIEVNGLTRIASVHMNISHATWSERLCLSCRWRFVKNDYVELLAYQSSGGNLDIRRLSDYSPVFEMTMVAPYYP